MRGFSLLETLMVICILAALASSASWYGIDSYLRSQSRMATQTILVSLLEARAEALHETCLESACDSSRAHGIYVQPTSVTVFEGNSYERRYSLADQSFSLSGIKRIEGSSEVEFESGTGSSATNTQFSIQTVIGTTTFLIAEDGQVSEFNK